MLWSALRSITVAQYKLKWGSIYIWLHTMPDTNVRLEIHNLLIAFTWFD